MRIQRAMGRTHGDLDLETDKVLNPSFELLRTRAMDTFDTCPLQPPPAGSPGQARAIRRRLLERVADADNSHTTIDGDEGDWQPFLEGVTMKVLREHDGVLSYLLRLQPGAVLPPHRHPRDEECIVLDGHLRVGTHIDIGPGGYHLARGGALHASITTATGATIFLRGAVPEAGHVLG
jgi:quercetin dioxygenase-like cupin family protein